MKIHDLFLSARNENASTSTRSETGNLQKYATTNPLQRYLLTRYVKTLESMIPSDVRTVLDAGGGEGFLSAYIASTQGSACSVYDKSAEAIERCKRLHPKLQTTIGDLYDLQTKNQRFDLFLCAQVLEHMEDPERVLQKFLSAQPKYVLLTVPHEPYFRMANLLRGKNVRRLGNDPEHIQAWNPKTFSAFLEKAGFRILEKRTSFPWVLMLCTPIRKNA